MLSKTTSSGSWQPLPLAGAGLDWWPDWLGDQEADRLLLQLRATIPWEVHRIRLFGREVDSPRLSCWIGDPGASYIYSRTRFEPHPWDAALTALRDRVELACGCRFNSVLANLYRNGDDAMGWHSDDEPELGMRPVIASLSLGAARRLLFKARIRSTGVPARSQHVLLPHGSLLRMAGDTQRLYQHALPRTRQAIGTRLNLTFRWIEPGAASRGRSPAPSKVG